VSYFIKHQIEIDEIFMLVRFYFVHFISSMLHYMTAYFVRFM